MFLGDKSVWKPEYDFHQLAVSSLDRITQIRENMLVDQDWSSVKIKVENYLLDEDKASFSKLNELFPPM